MESVSCPLDFPLTLRVAGLGTASPLPPLHPAFLCWAVRSPGGRACSRSWDGCFSFSLLLFPLPHSCPLHLIQLQGLQALYVHVSCSNVGWAPVGSVGFSGAISLWLRWPAPEQVLAVVACDGTSTGRGSTRAGCGGLRQHNFWLRWPAAVQSLAALAGGGTSLGCGGLRRHKRWLLWPAAAQAVAGTGRLVPSAGIFMPLTS